MPIVDVKQGDATIAVMGIPCSMIFNVDHDPHCPTCADGRMFFGSIVCGLHSDHEALDESGVLQKVPGIGHQLDCRDCASRYRDTRRHVVATLIDRGVDV